MASPSLHRYHEGKGGTKARVGVAGAISFFNGEPANDCVVDAVVVVIVVGVGVVGDVGCCCCSVEGCSGLGRACCGECATGVAGRCCCGVRGELDGTLATGDASWGREGGVLGEVVRGDSERATLLIPFDGSWC